jgi:hypothetical protein
MPTHNTKWRTAGVYPVIDCRQCVVAILIPVGFDRLCLSLVFNTHVACQSVPRDRNDNARLLAFDPLQPLAPTVCSPSCPSQRR